MPAFTVTLTNADTNYELLALVRAIDANFIDGGRHVVIQADPANTVPVKVARDVNLAAGRYGYVLNSSEGQVMTSGSQGRFVLAGLYARGIGAAGQKLAIDVTR